MYIKNPEYFITTVREGSISKAAEKLYLSQPYLSQCIARTEKELGCLLYTSWIKSETAKMDLCITAILKLTVPP